MISTVDDNRKKTLSSQIFYERTGYNNHNQHFFFLPLTSAWTRDRRKVQCRKKLLPSRVWSSLFAHVSFVFVLLYGERYLCFNERFAAPRDLSTDGAIYRISEPEPHSGLILGDKKGISSWAHSVWVRDFAPNENKQVSKWVRLCGFSCSRESQVDIYRNRNRPLNRLFKALALRCKHKFLQGCFLSTLRRQ